MLAGGGGILASDSISGQDIGICIVCLGLLLVFVGILVLYLTQTKNYTKADIESIWFAQLSRYLHISDVIQICNKLFKFFERN